MSSIAPILTKYFHTIQTRTNLKPQRFDSKSPYHKISYKIVCSGRLDDTDTHKLYEIGNKPHKIRKEEKNESKKEKNESLDVIISIAALKTPHGGEGVALIPASLDKEGRLTCDLESQTPWIPSDLLSSPGTPNRALMIGKLSAFWAWRMDKGIELASTAQGWKDVINYAEAMFKYVWDEKQWPHDLALESGKELLHPNSDNHQCWIAPGKQIIANGGVLDLYKFLIDSGEFPQPYNRLFAADITQKSEDKIDMDHDRLLKNAIRAVGSMSDGFPLTASQRRAVHAFLQDGAGDITAVSGPPGTGKTTMLQAVVASLIVQHCLDNKSAPLIIGTSTNNQAVTNIIDSFSSVAKEDAGILAKRWIPVATENGASHESLRSLAAYAPSQTKTKEAKDKGYLIEGIGKNGIYSQYSEPEYIEQATTYFLDLCQTYTKELNLPLRVSLKPTEQLSSLKRAEHFLKIFVAKCNKYRSDLLLLRHKIDKAFGYSLDTDAPLKIENLKREQEVHQECLKFWQYCLESGSEYDSSFIIDINYDENEPADKLHTVEEFVSFYQDSCQELSKQLCQLERERDERARQEKEMQSQYANNKEAKKLINALARHCLLTEKQVAKLKGAKNLLELDQALDTTVRHAQFWLAVHRYEAQWLITCLKDDVIPAKERHRTSEAYMDKYWKQATALTPCFVMTAYQAPKYFKLWVPDGEPAKFDLERADLLIVDEAGQVDTSLGASALALAKRALIVGDVKQLAPVWGIDPDSDEVMGQSFGLNQRWDWLKTRGLTASDHSSLMQAATTASNWCFGPDNDCGLFLAEHFRCRAEIIDFCNQLLYKGQLVPSKPTEGYKLEGKVPYPFLFHEIPQCNDQRQGSSRVNKDEAKQIARWIAEHYEYYCAIYDALDDPDKEKQIFGIVTPFSAQAQIIHQALIREAGSNRAKHIKVGTAHALQGAERNIVLFSSVYGENSAQASFIDNTLELMNVAVSRAKDLFIVFGTEKRRHDQGSVFKLIQALSKKDEPKPASTTNEIVQPARASDSKVVPENYLQTNPVADQAIIVSTMTKIWHENNVFPNKKYISASLLNEALRQAGFIQKNDDNDWEPTDKGVEIGIMSYQGDGYTNVKYTPDAQVTLVDMINSGKIQLF